MLRSSRKELLERSLPQVPFLELSATWIIPWVKGDGD
jgi:hypothetical protein